MAASFRNFVVTLIICTATNAQETSPSESNNFIEVETDYGVFRGRSAISSNGRTFWQFRGIRYALPAVGVLRFNDPLEIKIRWDKPKLVAEYKPNCIAFDNSFHIINGNRAYYITGSEDCLYLNIHTPSIQNKKPVLFYIPGGAFSFGGPKEYDATYLMDRDVVLVNVAYRLGPFGFLSTGDKVIPGNMGLKDQLAALKWIKSHIFQFGGDPNKISLSGLGAGAASVHYMYLSPLTKGLFHNGYSYSGSVLCPWAFFTDIPEKTQWLATKMACNTSTSEEIVACLRQIDAKKLLETMAQAKVFLYNPSTIFGPVVDTASPQPFLPRPPEIMMQEGRFQDLPWITGFTAEDGLYPAAEFIFNPKLFQKLMDNWNTFLPAILFYNTSCLKDVGDVSLGAVMEYQKNNERSLSSSVLQLMTERLYARPALQSAAYMTLKNKQRPYVYSFMYRATQSFSIFLRPPAEVDKWEVSHRDDVSLVYDHNPIFLRSNGRDRAMSDELITLAVEFAFSGSLPPSFQMWEPSTNNSFLFKYLEISGPGDYAMFEKPRPFAQLIDKSMKYC